jgi:hypothetical protein
MVQNWTKKRKIVYWINKRTRDITNYGTYYWKNVD